MRQLIILARRSSRTPQRTWSSPGSLDRRPAWPPAAPAAPPFITICLYTLHKIVYYFCIMYMPMVIYHIGWTYYISFHNVTYVVGLSAPREPPAAPGARRRVRHSTAFVFPRRKKARTTNKHSSNKTDKHNINTYKSHIGHLKLSCDVIFVNHYSHQVIVFEWAHVNKQPPDWTTAQNHHINYMYIYIYIEYIYIYIHIYIHA